ncbi:protein PHLOEM PROTEIN 2-LIKE A10-like isoform X1 [Apium graveolens]|uniref:protein PHLOEM PROTEIN 2-LIKE A10-like isoform X1 n=1 Tax=Apium graveolens TaxID=4045 RepID=UPI003D7BB250
MDLGFIKKGHQITNKQKKLLIILAALGVSSYGLYKVYNFPCMIKKRKKLSKLMGTLVSVIEMVSDSAEAIGVVSKDMKQFLQSDCDQIPHSLTQLSKIVRSEEFSMSLSRVSEAVTLGVLRGCRVGIEDENGGVFGFADKVFDKMTSRAGTGFVSVVAGSFARNLVLGFRTKKGIVSVGSKVPEWLVDVMCDERCKVVVAEYIKAFVSTAVDVYLERTMSVNVYDDMFSGLTNPKHQGKVRDVLVSVCNGAVETFVRTTHEVLTRPNSDSSSSVVETIGSPRATVDALFDQNARNLQEKISSFDIRNSDWVSSFSSTLSVPSNRRFVLGMTRRVTYETTRSFMVFFFKKLIFGLRRGFNLVHDEVMDRGLEIIRFVGAKSFVITAVCLALSVYCILCKQSPFFYM